MPLNLNLGKMKTLARFIQLAGLLCYLVALSSHSVSAEPINKTVLLLFPYQQDLPMHLLGVQALREELGKTDDFALDVYYEYLDLNRIPKGEFQQRLFDMYAAKYRNKRIDLVIVQTKAMLDLWLEQRGKIAPDAPVVFFDTITDSMPRQLPNNVTGVSGTADLTQSVAWLLHARPSINEVLLVQGAGPVDKEKEFYLPVETFLQQMSGKIKITDLSGFPLSEIQHRVAALPMTSVVLSNVMFEDAAGIKFRPIDALRQLASTSAVPVISAYDQLIGTGIIGGYMYSVEQQARQAAKIGLRILHGESASTIPTVKDQNNHFIFDHLALQRFGIPLEDLPLGSLIKNRQYTLWEEHRPQIIAATSSIAVLSILVIILLGVTRKLNRTRLALAHFNVNLETLVQERTALLSQTNTRLQDEITERKETAEALQVAQQELMRREIERTRVEEREHLLEDMHDGFGSQLTSARLRVEEGELDQPQLAELLYECMTDLHLVVDTVKSTETDLGESLRNLRNRYQHRLSGRNIELHWDLRVDDALPMPQRKILTILRIVQESINNALKHAQASRICIEARYVNGQLSISIRDDGIGLPEHPSYGKGLHNMHSRAVSLGGKLSINCDSPGTWIELNLPLKSQ